MPITVQRKGEEQAMSLAEEKALDEKIQGLMDERDQVELSQGVNHISKRDKTSLNLEISRLMRIKEKRGVVRAEGKEREEVMKQIKALEEVLQKDMPSLATFQNTNRKHGVSYLRLKRWCDERNTDTAFARKWNSMVHKWKSLRRKLEPEDPQIADVMYLFPEKGW